jgi:hypothetical protein
MKMIRLPLWVKWGRKVNASKIIAGQSKPSTGNISARLWWLIASAFVGY